MLDICMTLKTSVTCGSYLGVKEGGFLLAPTAKKLISKRDIQAAPALFLHKHSMIIFMSAVCMFH